MREIKFRAWDKSDKRMMYRGVFDRNWYATPSNDSEGCHCIRGISPDDRPMIELMEFTGLKDKSGREIYEGDILSPGYAEDELFVVVFDETKGRFAEQRVSKKYPTHAGFIMDGSFLRTTFSIQKVEIIGNIYENPNLLKGE